MVTRLTKALRYDSGHYPRSLCIYSLRDKNKRSLGIGLISPSGWLPVTSLLSLSSLIILLPLLPRNPSRTLRLTPFHHVPSGGPSSLPTRRRISTLSVDHFSQPFPSGPSRCRTHLLTSLRNLLTFCDPQNLLCRSPFLIVPSLVLQPL